MDIASMSADGGTPIDLARIASCLAEFLGDRSGGLAPEVLAKTNFEVIGMDSVDCLLAVLHIEEQLGLSLDPDLLLCHPNLAEAVEAMKEVDGSFV
jgi:acyl carrier protein